MSTQNVNRDRSLVSTYFGDKNFKDEVERRCESYGVQHEENDHTPYLLTEQDGNLIVRYRFVVPMPENPTEDRRVRERGSYIEECLFRSHRGQKVAIKTN